MCMYSIFYIYIVPLQVHHNHDTTKRLTKCLFGGQGCHKNAEREREGGMHVHVCVCVRGIPEQECLHLECASEACFAQCEGQSGVKFGGYASEIFRGMLSGHAFTHTLAPSCVPSTAALPTKELASTARVTCQELGRRSNSKKKRSYAMLQAQKLGRSCLQCTVTGHGNPHEHVIVLYGF